jgi:hypothetical protein
VTYDQLVADVDHECDKTSATSWSQMSTTSATSATHERNPRTMVETARVIVNGCRASRQHHLAILAALVDLMAAEARTTPGAAGLQPVRVLWKGGRTFEIVCVVGKEAASSPLLMPYRDTKNAYRDRFYLTDQTGDSGSFATCEIPHVTKFAGGTRMTVEQKMHMAGVIIEYAARVLQGGGPICASFLFAKFWQSFTKEQTSLLEIYDSYWMKIVDVHKNKWKHRLVTSKTTYDAEWPRLGGDRCERSKKSTEVKEDVQPVVPSIEDTIEALFGPNELFENKKHCSDILSLSRKLDDLERLWAVSVGNPTCGGIWAAGPSPTHLRFPNALRARYSEA